MKLRKLIASTMLVLGLSCSFSHAVPLPENYKNYSTRIDIGPMAGSGFFVQTSNSVYLATARHVLFNFTPQITNSPFSLIAPKAKCTSYSQTNPAVFISLDLQTLLKDGEVRYSLSHDLALVRIQECSPTNRLVVHSINSEAIEYSGEASSAIIAREVSMLKKFSDVREGGDIFVAGFPSSVGLAESPQIDLELPLLRKGIVAGKNSKTGKIIIDCTCNHGNSGGPAISFDEVALGEWRVYIIGIVTEYVPYRQVWINQSEGYINENRSNSGYSVVEPADEIIKMMWK